MTCTHLFASVFALLLSIVYSQGTFPCHTGRENLGAAGCTDITLPYNLCVKCPLKDVAWNGDFQNCRSIYNIDAPGCQGQLIEYVQMNPCDWRRAEQVDQWVNSADPWIKNQAKEKLDYFVYAICEQCCDCIPIASTNMDHSTAVQDESKLYSHTRGNCAAHAHYDICRLLPDIKAFKNPGESMDTSGKPNICWNLLDWFGQNAGWLTDHNTYASPPIQDFLKNVNRKIQCGSEKVWSNCKAMEKAQNRI